VREHKHREKGSGIRGHGLGKKTQDGGTGHQCGGLGGSYGLIDHWLNQFENEGKGEQKKKTGE